MIDIARNRPLQTIGATELVSFGRDHIGVPAKIDTGADRSAVWASNIQISRDGVLEFSLFGPESPHYTGKIFKRKDFSAATVRSSNGTKEIRYRTHLSVTIAGRKIRTLFYLSNRSSQKFPILIGRKTIRSKFLVDVTRNSAGLGKRVGKDYSDVVSQDPHAFHKKYKKKLAL